MWFGKFPGSGVCFSPHFCVAEAAMSRRSDVEESVKACGKSLHSVGFFSSRTKLVNIAEVQPQGARHRLQELAREQRTGTGDHQSKFGGRR